MQTYLLQARYVSPPDSPCKGVFYTLGQVTAADLMGAIEKLKLEGAAHILDDRLVPFAKNRGELPEELDPDKPCFNFCLTCLSDLPDLSGQEDMVRQLDEIISDPDWGMSGDEYSEYRGR